MIVLKKHTKQLFVLLLLFACSHCCFSQFDSLRPKKRYKISGFPVIFYTPETRFAFGAAGICTFNFKKDSLHAPSSSFNLGFAYTQNNQVLFYLPYFLFFKNRTYQVYGELGYNKYTYNFYGVGNDQPKDYVEKYGVEFPRLRITALKKLSKHFYAGPRYAFDNFSLFKLDTAGQLIKREISGSKGGYVSGVGIVNVYDSRDNIFYPSRGFYGELVVYRDDKLTGSSFNYTRIALDVTKYFSYKENILALNLYTIYSDSDLPFFQMGNLGGMKKMRGFYEGRYRDNNLLVFQAEYRRHLFWLLGFTVFADAGQVAKRYDAFNDKNWRYTYGGGLRLTIDKAQKINLRIDVGVGDKKVLPYFTIGEAF
ncbi:MAG: BamA/TamA family outer membrane protein [Bacteroidetes bacterium]|nr:BamA/TamA family outer membrane protein [Bacteroidota bacterium]